jgi:hypothetical protein
MLLFFNGMSTVAGAPVLSIASVWKAFDAGRPSAARIRNAVAVRLARPWSSKLIWSIRFLLSD